MADGWQTRPRQRCPPFFIFNGSGVRNWGGAADTISTRPGCAFFEVACALVLARVLMRLVGKSGAESRGSNGTFCTCPNRTCPHTRNPARGRVVMGSALERRMLLGWQFWDVHPHFFYARVASDF